MTTTVVRLDRLQAGLTAALRAALPSATVVWAPSEFPRASANALVLACRMLAGPDADPIGGESLTPATLPMTATLVVIAPVIGEAGILFVSGRRFEHVFASTDATAERDAWLAEILDDPMVDATFEASDVDMITIAATEFGDLYKVSARGSASGLVSLTVNTTETGLVQAVDVRSYVEIQAYSTSKFPRSGAAAMLNRFRGRTRLPTIANILDAHGLGFVGTPGRVVTLDALAGPTWQSRSALTVWISQLSLAAETAPRIERVRGNVYARGAGAPIQVPIDTEPET